MTKKRKEQDPSPNTRWQERSSGRLYEVITQATMRVLEGDAELCEECGGAALGGETIVVYKQRGGSVAQAKLLSEFIAGFLFKPKTKKVVSERGKC
jgi:hypothetical protein